MTTPLNKLIDASITCSKCGAKGFLSCDCWEKCSCGWIADKGKPCRNPETTRCSTKVKHSSPRDKAEK